MHQRLALALEFDFQQIFALQTWLMVTLTNSECSQYGLMIWYVLRPTLMAQLQEVLQRFDFPNQILVLLAMDSVAHPRSFLMIGGSLVLQLEVQVQLVL